MQRILASVVGMLLLIALPVSSSSVALAAPIAQETPAQAEAPLGNAFTHQGQLSKAGEAVNAACRMTFRLFDAQSGGTQLGDAQVIDPVQVTNGLFTVVLNGNDQFGPAAFDGEERWLQITVRCPDDAEGVVLPRQRLTAAPYALTSLSTERLQGRPVSAAAPAAGQVLAWDGSAWSPQDPAGGGAARPIGTT